MSAGHDSIWGKPVCFLVSVSKVLSEITQIVVMFATHWYVLAFRCPLPPVTEGSSYFIRRVWLRELQDPAIIRRCDHKQY